MNIQWMTVIRFFFLRLLLPRLLFQLIAIIKCEACCGELIWWYEWSHSYADYICHASVFFYLVVVVVCRLICAQIESLAVTDKGYVYFFPAPILKVTVKQFSNSVCCSSGVQVQPSGTALEHCIQVCVCVCEWAAGGAKGEQWKCNNHNWLC